MNLHRVTALPLVLLAWGSLCGLAQATPVGDTFDLAFTAFTADANDAFNFENGEAGETGGVVGNFTFGTPGTFDLFGNTIVVDSVVEPTGPDTEDWVISMSAQDGGLFFDPANPGDFNWFSFIQMSVGTLEFDGNGPVGGDPIFSPTNAAPVVSGLSFTSEEDTIEILAGDNIVATRRMFATNQASGVFLDVGLDNSVGDASGPQDEIRLLNNTQFATLTGVIDDVTEVRIRFSVTTIPEPATGLLAVLGVAMGLLVSRRL